ncbi:putative amidotransferase [Bifidobacterium boum]|uniref:Putative amidotransferase n=1 Tax=Bifidobacterium boum TaxID=78343 RepID=A0A086ZQH5_9BIFI|nr:putative amidotransferase [Bifidobacterium boum]
MTGWLSPDISRCCIGGLAFAAGGWLRWCSRGDAWFGGRLKPANKPAIRKGALTCLV